MLSAIALIAWSTLAGGGVYRWAGLTAVALAAATTVLTRPRIAARADTRPLDMALLCALALLCLQLLPLPPQVRWAVSSQLDVDRLTLLLMPDAASTWLPVSLAPAETAYATALVATTVGLFWSLRHLIGRGLATPLLSSVAFVGIVASVAAVVQRAIDPTRLYAIWQPLDAGARPFGPFVNRNHFATWLLLALPLVAGWLASAVGAARRPSGRWRSALSRVAESQMAWVAVALTMMTIALVASSSRAAFGALAAEGLVSGTALLARGSRRGLAVAGGTAAALAVVVAITVPSGLVLDRVDETLARGTAERTTIWRDARTVTAQYPVTGTGLGTFERAMLIYQSTNRATRTNHAHSQYLQLAAEGGALLTVPAAITCLVFALLARRRLKEDRSPTFWLRVGAVAGMVGVSVQGFWETGLRMPANGVMLALAAAVAVHRPSGQSVPRVTVARPSGDAPS